MKLYNRTAKWTRRLNNEDKKYKNLSFYERYCKDKGVKIDMKFANEIDERLDRARSRCLEEANKTIKIAKAMSK